MPCKALEELKEDWRKEGRVCGLAETINNLLESTDWDIEQIMDAMGVPEEEKSFLREKIPTNSENPEISPIGDDVMEYLDSLLTPEEIEKSNRQVSRTLKRIEAREKRKRRRNELMGHLLNGFKEEIEIIAVIRFCRHQLMPDEEFMDYIMSQYNKSKGEVMDYIRNVDEEDEARDYKKTRGVD